MPQEVIMSLVRLAEAYEDISSQKSIEYYQEAILWCIQEDDYVQLAEIRDKLGSLYHNTHRYDEAIEEYQLAISFFRELEEVEKLARALMYIGGSYNQKYRFQEAIRVLEESVELSVNLPQIREEALNRLGRAKFMAASQGYS